MMKFATRAALLAAIMTSGTTGAWAQTPGTAPIVGLTTTTTATDTAKVTALDLTTRTVTVAFPDGTTSTGKAGDAVQNLAQVKVGDTVVAAYQERLSFVLSAPNATTPSNRDTVGAIGAAPGQKPAGILASQALRTYYVVAVNPGVNTISIVKPSGGQIRTVGVTDPAAQKDLSRVKPGDKLTVIDTQVLFVGIERRA
jgi:hypothetical protein